MWPALAHHWPAIPPARALPAHANCLPSLCRHIRGADDPAPAGSVGAVRAVRRRMDTLARRTADADGCRAGGGVRHSTGAGLGRHSHSACYPAANTSPQGHPACRMGGEYPYRPAAGLGRLRGACRNHAGLATQHPPLCRFGPNRRALTDRAYTTLPDTTPPLEGGGRGRGSRGTSLPPRADPAARKNRAFHLVLERIGVAMSGTREDAIRILVALHDVSPLFALQSRKRAKAARSPNRRSSRPRAG
jgi:hypothetical protein